MRICILSMQGVDNYGSVLQSYSLKSMIEKLGHEVSFIDIKKGDNSILNEECYKLCKNIDFPKRNGLFVLYNRISNKLKNASSERMYREFRENILGIRSFQDNGEFDVCVIGSDEVFNCIQMAKWGFDRQLYGDVKNASKVITYAACCGSTTEKQLTNILREEIKECFCNISSFSVRDENTFCFVRTLANKNPERNLDPVAVGDFEKELSKVLINRKVPPRFCIVYAYQDRINDSAMINAILELCKEKNMVPISIFGSQSWIEDNIVLTPFEVLKAFQASEFVITDTFHGTIFGAKYSNKMAVIIRDSNKEKLSDLVKKIGLEDHVVSDTKTIEKLFDLKINRKNIDDILSLERIRSLNYLEKSIESNE